jgi:pimeloyl-ACP methyl ester carboxylesterase
VVPGIHEAGHTATAVELPVSDPEGGLTEYRDAVLRAIDHLEAPVVVGHSMAGLVIPLVASARPVAGMVFLCAFVPEPGKSFGEMRKEQPMETYQLETSEFEDRGDNVWMVGPATARELFFHDVPDEVADRAYRRLRPQCYRWVSETCALESWPDTPSTVVACIDDRAISIDWCRRAARRLGTVAIELPGGHSPFLTRPEELAGVLGSASS